MTVEEKEVLKKELMEEILKDPALKKLVKKTFFESIKEIVDVLKSPFIPLLKT